MEQEQEQGEPQEGGSDPLSALGQGIDAMVEAIGQSGAPDEIKKQAMAVKQSFDQLVQMVGGGQGPQEGPQPMSGNEQMGGGNPNAQAVR